MAENLLCGEKSLNATLNPVTVHMPKESPGENTTLRARKLLVEKINKICLHRKMHVADYVSPILEGPVERDYEAYLADTSREYEERKKQKKKP